MNVFRRLFGRKRPPELQAEIAACLPIFEQLASQLDSVASEVETKVVDTCSSLGSVVTRTKHIVDAATHCLDGGDGNMGGEELVATTRTALTRLLTVTDCLGDIGKLADSVRLVALNGRIEAARAGKHGDAFSVVASETNALASKAKETSQTARQTVEELQGLLETEGQLPAAHSARCGELITEILRQLDIHNSIVSSGMTDLAETSEEVSKEISRVIIGLQFQDAVNQRLEHVVTTIREICHELRPLTTEASPEVVRRRTNEWNEIFAKRTTMASERVDAAHHAGDSDAGSVELF